MNTECPLHAAYHFDQFTLDLARGALLAPDGAEMPLRPKSFALLQFLLENAGRLLDRETIMQAIWPDVFVTDDSITQCVSEICRTLGGEAHCLLQTLPRRGYRFVAEVACIDLAVDDTREAVQTSCSIGTAPKPPLVSHSLPELDRGCLSLVVLPFTNECDEDWFADGVVEDLITAMAHSLPHGSRLIARGTSFALKGKIADPREAGREFGVRYALDGRVRRRGQRMCLVAELVDTATAGIVWTQEFDCQLADLALVQERITAQIANALRYEMASVAGEQAKRKTADEIVADDLVMQGLATFYQPRSRAQLEAARGLFEQAVAAGSRNIAGSVGLSMVHGYLALGMDTRHDQHLAKARMVLAQARGAAPNRTEVLFTEALLQRAGGEPEEACRTYERLLGYDRNNANAYIQLGVAHRYAGRPERLLPLLERAIHLSPLDPETALWFNYAAMAEFDLGRIDEGVNWARRAVNLIPTSSTSTSIPRQSSRERVGWTNHGLGLPPD